MQRKVGSSYILCFLIFALIAGVASRFVGRSLDALGCYEHRTTDSFMAYCGSTQYGDYEHGAYYFGVEAEAVENLKRAEVLFLGNSRSQIGFSTDEVNRYFRDHRIPYYVLGFGYDERYEFELALIKKYRLAPKAIVVNADPFFRGRSSFSPDLVAPIDNAMAAFDRSRAFLDALEKKLFGMVRWGICDQRPSLCLQQNLSIYRDARDGSWIWRNAYTREEQGNIPVGQGKEVEGLPEAIDIEKANRLIRVSGISKECLILTATPNSQTDADAYVTHLADALAVKLVLPGVRDLYTWDGSHLTWSSAQRWSRRFLEEADPVLRRCAFSGS
ncbi:hypothetical protein [Bradyrhizobium sp.]|uniref:hypothetical protein n=1 Tax=Bradyrhizobium sp. TaxID=376 RepID=UPI0039E4F1E4